MRGGIRSYGRFHDDTARRLREELAQMQQRGASKEALDRMRERIEETQDESSKARRSAAPSR